MQQKTKTRVKLKKKIEYTQDKIYKCYAFDKTQENDKITWPHNLVNQEKKNIFPFFNLLTSFNILKQECTVITLHSRLTWARKIISSHCIISLLVR